MVGANSGRAARTVARAGEYLFSSVEKALASTYETLAASCIGGPSYGVPTSRSTATDTISTQDRLIQAVWIKSATEAALTDTQLAWCKVAHVGMGEERRDGLDVLTRAFAGLHNNSGLLRAVIEREFEHGETYARSFADIGKECGVSNVTAWKLGQKVAKAVKTLGTETTDILNAVFQVKGWIRAGSAH